MALIECHECGGRISDSAAACPHCGAPLRRASGEIDFNALSAGGTQHAVNRPLYDEPPAKRKSLVQPLLAGLGLVIVLGLIYRVVSPSSGVSSSHSDTDFTAKYGAREIVTSVLKAPSTADFIETEIIERAGAGYCLVRVTVDAENSFGTKIRGRYLVVLQLVGDSYSYRKNSAVIDEKEISGDIGLAAFKELNGWRY